MSSSTGPWVEQWLSRPRLGTYLRSAGNDQDRALALYEWNAELSAAVMRDLAHLEVALRNAYDRAFDKHWNGSAHWTPFGWSGLLTSVPNPQRTPRRRQRADARAA
jgi:hypothetical protein